MKWVFDGYSSTSDKKRNVRLVAFTSANGERIGLKIERDNCFYVTPKEFTKILDALSNIPDEDEEVEEPKGFDDD